MASKSQTFEIVLTANGSAVTEVMEDLKGLAKGYADELDKLTEKKKKGIELSEEEEKRAESLVKKIQGLNTAWERNAIELRKVDEIMKDLTQATGNEMGRALKTLSARFKRAKSDAVDDLIKIKEQIQDVRHEMSKRDGVDALKKAKATLTELANTPLDKLKMGLESIEKRLSTMSEAEKQAADGLELLEGKSRYQAQIAVTQYGRAGTAPLSAMNDEQLRAEQQRLRSLYSGTEGAKGFEGVSSEALNRLQQANKLIRERADAEREAAKAAKEVERAERERLEFAKQGRQTSRTLANMELASYEELDEALKHLQAQKLKYQSGDTKHIQRNLALQDRLKQKMKEMEQMLLSDEEISRRVNNSKKYNIIQLQQAYDTLKYKLAHTNAEEKTDLLQIRRQMKALAKDINEVKGESTGLTKVWKTAVRNIGTYVGVFAGFNYVKGKLEEVIKKNYELSDSLTNVRKVSGLTMDDINQLYTNISKIDTRNTINTLTDLAYQGGKLGIQEFGGVEALTGFVKAAEQVQAALGEDLGEDALPALAKLTENMGLIKSMGVEEAMQKTASAIFALSTSSVSTGTGIVDFAKRLMPVAKSAGVATSELLGLASATESSGLAAEVASTAFVKMFPSIYKNADALETYLGISKGVIREMYDQDRAMDAMVMIFDKMQDMGNLNKYPEIFKLLGSEGARMNTVMSAMANNVDMLRTHLNTSNKAFEEGTAVINEYNLQTNSAAGILERANNIWEKAFVNPEGVDMVKELAEAWYLLSNHVAKSDTWMTALRTSLKSIETIVATLIFLLPVLIRIMAFYGVVNTVKYIATNFWDMRKAILAAAGAQGKLNAAMRANMFSILISLGLALVSCFWDLYKIIEKDVSATKKLSQEEKDLADAEKMVGDNTRKEVGHLNALYKAATDTLQPMEKRMQWVQQLKKEFPDYFKDLSDEAILTGKAADKYEALAQSLMKAAKARAYQQKMDQISEESVKLQEEIDADLDYLNQNEKKYKEEKKKQQQRDDITSYGGAVFAGEAAKQGITGKLDAFVDKYEDTEDRVLKKQAQIAQNDQRIQKLAEKVMENTPTPKATEFEPGGGGDEGGSGSGSGTKELNAEYRDEQQKAKDIINKVKNFYQRQINAIKDMAAVGTIDEQRQKDMVDGMQQRMNEALSKVRKAIGGVENDWEDFRETMINDLYEPLNEKGENWSTDLVKDIVDNDLVQLRKMIQKLSDTLKKNGGVLLDEILRKATEDEGKNVDLANKRMRERQQELRRKNYTEQVDYDYIQHMDQFGIGTPTAEQDLYIQTMSQQGNKAEIEKFFNDRNDLWRKGFLKARENLWQVIDTEIKTAEDGKSLLQIMYGDNYETVLKGSGLESLLSMQLDQWQVFYQKLIEMSDAWDDAQEKAYQEQKKRNDKRFENLPDVIGLNQMDTDYGKQQAENARWGKRQSIWERAGLGSMSKVTDDPEIKQYEVRQAKAQMYYEWMQRLRDQDKISEEMLMDAKQKWADAQMALQDKVAEHARQKMEQIQQLLDPIKEFGAAAGDAMYLTINGLEGEGDAWRNAVKNIIKTYGEMTIKLIEEQLLKMLVLKQHHQEEEDEEQAHQDRMKQIRGQGDTNTLSTENLLNAQIFSLNKKAHKQEEQEQRKSEAAKAQIVGDGGETMVDVAANVANQKTDIAAMEAQETEKIEQQQQATSLSGMISDTVAKVVLGIAGGSARTVSELGWWGLPLVAVISAALMGLLNYALSTIGSSSGNKSNSPNRKVKLASGMLTYDSGNLQEVAGEGRSTSGRLLPTGRKNVQTVVGDDGRVYRAREQRSLPEGVSMVTEPIATRVNGQQALVGERGPEIVIGRKTTRAIQMNRPDLLRDLALIDRGITTRKVRTFDEGNLSDLASAIQPAADQPQQQSGQIDPATAEALRMLPASMLSFSQMMTAIQQQGIPAEIAMFDTSTRKGLRSQLRQADKMMAPYERK